MNLRQVVIFFAFLFSGTVFGQPKVDFFPKSLVKEVSKYTQLDSTDLKEISVKGENSAAGKYFELNEKPNLPYSFVYIGRVNSCRAGGCTISTPQHKDEQSEYFDYFILFDKSASIKQIKVFNYRATHGQEVTAAGWLRQFTGYNGITELQVGKTIDAISGATISVSGITADIQHKTRLLKQLVN